MAPNKVPSKFPLITPKMTNESAQPPHFIASTPILVMRVPGPFFFLLEAFVELPESSESSMDSFQDCRSCTILFNLYPKIA